MSTRGLFDPFLVYDTYIETNYIMTFEIKIVEPVTTCTGNVAGICYVNFQECDFLHIDIYRVVLSVIYLTN